MAIVVFIVPAVILALLGIAALRWGVDSRYGSSDDHAPSTPVGLQLH